MKPSRTFTRHVIGLALGFSAMALAGSLWLAPPTHGDASVRLVIDGREIVASPAPMIRNDRTLVPLRVVSEELGAEVTWNEAERSVSIVKGGRSILLRIDRSLMDYTLDGAKYFQISDVAPQIFYDRTFVPLRVISNALGVGIDWEDATRTVTVDSAKTSSITPFYETKISSVQSGKTLSGTTLLQTSMPSVIPAGASEIRYLLISPETGKGFVIARGTNFGGAYTWVPNMRDNGQKVLVAGLYNQNGKLLSGDAIPVNINLQPAVSLSGLTEGQTVEGAISLSAKLNFSAGYVKYTVTHPASGKTFTTGEQDPLGSYAWTPPLEYNGEVQIKVTAYDQKHQPYMSQSVNANVAVTRKLALSGVKAGQTVDRPVTLAASRNFDVIETEYLLRDKASGVIGTLSKVHYASHVWFPGPGLTGNKELFVRVKAVDGTVYTSAPIGVTVSGAPKILLQGAGPNQVITTAVPANLKVQTNVTLTQVRYIMTNTSTGAQKILADLKDASAMQGYTYTPVQGQDGNWKIKAVGTYGTGQTISTEEVTVKVYTGKIFTAKPVVEREAFLSFASGLAVADAKTSGMSAALQTAQAILETGWGQSVPVDKYTGQFSYNLFGIKGSAAAGSVISNTWEEYNGVAFRVDAKFRAYNNVNESWADHKKLLLTGARYEPFRAVMYDSALGAWALRRAGYATDSKYPIKLMDLIDRYQLEALDLVGI